MTRHIKVYDATKTALGGKFIPLKAYLRKKLKLHISAQNFYFKKLGREEETKLRERRGVRVEIGKPEGRQSRRESATPELYFL